MLGTIRLGYIMIALSLLMLTACQIDDSRSTISLSPKPESAPASPGSKTEPVAAVASSAPSVPAILPANQTVSTFDRPIETGLASWYGARHSGRRTADGGEYDRRAFTAAHPTLPFGTWLRVVNQSNNRSIDVVVTDRHPAKRGRIIDLSAEAARQIDMLHTGVARVALYLPSTPPVENATPPQISALPPARTVTKTPVMSKSDEQKPALRQVATRKTPPPKAAAVRLRSQPVSKKHPSAKNNHSPRQ